MRTQKNQMTPKAQNGWATLELTLLLPLVFALIALIFYFGQLSFVKLHLTSVTDAAARIAAIQNCNAAKSYIRDSFSGSMDFHIECSEGDIVSLTVKSSFASQIPLIHQVKKELIVHSYALNEKQLQNHEE